MTLRRLFSDLTRALGARNKFKRRYRSESAFEDDVWRVVRDHFRAKRQSHIVLTSHTRHHGPAEQAAWDEFLHSKPGPDVLALGTQNRLDIVVKPREGRSIGLEVKCLGRRGHAAKLTQGLGQVVLARANRDSTILLIHCGSVPAKQRRDLRAIARRICHGSPTQIIVVP